MELQPVTRTSSVELCARSLRDAVLRGTYPAGDRLPPERQLATTLGVNRVTVRGALAELVKEGLLSVRQGSGYEVREALSSGGIELLPSLAAHFDRRANVEAVRDLLAVSRAIAGVVLERLSHHRPSRAGVTAISKAIDVLEAMLPKPANRRLRARRSRRAARGGEHDRQRRAAAAHQPHRRRVAGDAGAPGRDVPRARRECVRLARPRGLARVTHRRARAAARGAVCLRRRHPPLLPEAPVTPSALLHRPASPREIVEARWLFALLAVQFIVPAVSYLVTPEVAIDTLDQLNRLLGGGPSW
jgi:DNA-binding FadR family transcriptional regulator